MYAFRMDPVLLDALRRQAQRDSITATSIIEEALRVYLAGKR